LPAEPGCVSNWYLKGFLGITSYDLDGISSATFKEGSGFGGLGLGYQFNSWLRFDVTGEYRNRSTVHGSTAMRATASPAPTNTPPRSNPG
jgi:opacity protein-like surface antigen